MLILHWKKKNHEKIRETLFTFKLSNADLLSIWRDFFHKNQKIRNLWIFAYEKCRESSTYNLTIFFSNFAGNCDIVTTLWAFSPTVYAPDRSLITDPWRHHVPSVRRRRSRHFRFCIQKQTFGIKFLQTKTILSNR